MNKKYVISTILKQKTHMIIYNLHMYTYIYVYHIYKYNMSICISKSRIATYSGNIPISMSSPPRGCASGLRTFLGRGYEPHRRHAPHRPRWQHCNLAQPGQRGPGRAGRAGVMFCDEKNMWKLSKYTIYIYIYNHLYTFVYIYIRIIYLLHTSYNS